MRALLPHLRLLTLRPEADDVLHSFLTTEEHFHVLHFHMFGALRTNIPDTLNIETMKRTTCAPTEYCVTFIPDEAVSKNFDHLKEEDVYVWSSLDTNYTLNNHVKLIANTDIYLTGFECLGSFYPSRICNLSYNEVTESFKSQPSISLAPSCFKTSVIISPTYYNMSSGVRPVGTKFGFHNILKEAQFIPKGQQLSLVFKMNAGDYSRGSICRRLWLIKESTVNEFLRVNGCKDFGEIQVVQSDKFPVFLKNIRYIKVDETQNN
jgi:hypothetical protein